MLEVGVAYRQRFIDNQNIRPTGSRDTEGQTHLHAARIGAHRVINGFANLRETLDFRHQRLDFLHLHAQQLASHEGILATSEIRVEAHAQFQ